MRWVAFMPLRGGSKSVANKNIRHIAGRPLFAWSLAEAIRSESFAAIYVSSDSEAIRAAVMAQFPTGVNVIARSAQSASDTASTEAAMLEFQKQFEFDVICLIQATSPLTQAEDLRRAKEQFLGQGLDSLLSTVNSERLFWQADNTDANTYARPLNYDPKRRQRRQDFAGWQMENGAFYMTRAEILREQSCRLGGRIGLYEMAEETALEIDTETDWLIAEQLLQKHRQTISRQSTIKVLVVDVDGTLTDAGMYYGADGEVLKKFNTRDAHGMLRLRAHGVMLCVITAEDSPSVAARMQKLGIDEYHAGVKDKLPLLQRLCERWQVSAQDIAYIGDDTGDLECLAYVGLGACPADAVSEVKAQAAYVCKQAGGGGAVREFCDCILQLNRRLAA